MQDIPGICFTKIGSVEPWKQLKKGKKQKGKPISKDGGPRKEKDKKKCSSTKINIIE